MYENTLGIELIKERDDFRSKLEVMETEVKGLKTDVKELKESREELRTRIMELAGPCRGYLIIRHRFLDTFRRDILKETLWTPMIQAGKRCCP